MFLKFNLKTTIDAYFINFLTSKLKSTYVDKPEIHDFWEMVYVESGEGISCADEKEFLMFPGDVIFHKPGEVHTINPINNTSVKAFFICFDLKSELVPLFENLKTSFNTEQKKLVYKMYDEAKRIFLFEDRYNRTDAFGSTALLEGAPLCSQQLFKIHLEELLITISRDIQKNVELIPYKTKDELDELMYQKAIEKIAECVYSDFSIDMLCSSLNCGRTYICSLFKKRSGFSIMQYYNNLRIKHAKKLIKEGKLSFSEISNKLNFTDQYYFSKLFKRIENITPSEYKKQVLVQTK